MKERLIKFRWEGVIDVGTRTQPPQSIFNYKGVN